MVYNSNNIAVKLEQNTLCKKYNAEYLEAAPGTIVGVAKDFSMAKMPINGLRHPREKNASGWYIWSGDEYSSEQDYFEPMHLSHVVAKYPFLLPYLGLAPGWRFLIDPNNSYEDVWFDKQLLDI